MKDILPILLLGGLALLLLRRPALRPPAAPTSLEGAIRAAAARHGVPACILKGIAYAESGMSPAWFFRYHPDGVSFGAFGLTRGAVSHMGGDWERVRRDLSYQAEMAAKYLRWLYDKLRSWDLAIQAYNLGLGNIQKGKRNYAYLAKVKRYC